MKKHLIFAGGGHSHIHSLSNLDKFIDAGWTVTVVNRSQFHYYSGMGPGLLSGYYNEDETRFNVKKIVESSGCRFVEAEVVLLVPDKQKIILSDGGELHYDIISFNIGSDIIQLPSAGDALNIYPVKPFENISLIRQFVMGCKKNIKIAIVGGGAAGVEVAANLGELAFANKVKAEVCIISRDRLLNGYSDKVYNKALKYLKHSGIKFIENRNVKLIDAESINFTTGEKLKYDIIVNASGIKPSGVFINSKTKTGADGGLSVNRYLQSVDYPQIFAGGDCITFEPMHLNKVGVYAVREGIILFRNILSYITNSELEEFKPQKSYLSILNMGFRNGVMLWRGSVFSGILPFYFKYYLDSSFMKKYQKLSVTSKSCCKL